MPLDMYREDKPQHLSKVKSIIAIAAGKGGVGKSSVTVNLALALKSQGFKVGVMDTDIYGPSMRKMLPEDRMPQQHGNKIQPATCNGIKMISMAYFKKDHEAAVVRAPIANGVITQFIQNVEWGELDYLLVDFPPGTGDVQLTLAQQANLTTALIVTTPQDISVLDVRKAMNMFRQVKIPILGIVENMSYYYHEKTDEKIAIFGKGGGEKLAREEGVPLLAQIPINPIICQSADQGKSLFDSPETMHSPIVQSFEALAEHVRSHVKTLQESGGITQEGFEMVWQEMK